jgi:hypothetical protein
LVLAIVLPTLTVLTLTLLPIIKGAVVGDQARRIDRSRSRPRMVTAEYWVEAPPAGAR